MRSALRVLSSSALVLALALPVSAAPAGAEAPGVTTTIYLLADQPEGGPFLMPVHREAPATLDLPRAAVLELLEGPTQAESDTVPAISTAIPAGVDLLGLTIEDRVATVDLEGTFDDGGGSASMFARLGQLVYTLTRFAAVDEVALRLDGQPVEVFSGEGLVLDGPIGRDWFTGQDSGILPPVLLETPAWGAVLAPYVDGASRVLTEPVVLSIYDTDGRELGVAILVHEDGDFSSWLPFEFPTSGYGAVMVEPADSAGLREHLVRFAADPVRGTGLACPDVPTPYFADVPDTSVHADAIDCAVHWRVLVGYADGTFAPSVAVTRAQAASAMARLLGAAGIELPTDAELTFADVVPTSPHAEAIAQLHELGVVRGFTPDHFGPERPVARGELATLVHRSVGLFDGASLLASEVGFGDDDGSTHEPAIDALAQLRLLAGTTSLAEFSPAATVTRAQLAAFVSRTLDLLVAAGHTTAPANVFDVHEAEVGDVVVGLTISSLEVSEPDAPYLTAHVAFTGEVTVAGTVVAYDDHEQFGDAVCMTSVDPASERSLPRMLQDTRYSWFCFTNSDVAAAEVFDPGTETHTTVVVDEFTIHYAPTEMWNTARLLRVEEGA